MDICDIANDYAERSLNERIQGRVQYAGHSAEECQECGCEIPEARRKAVPGCCMCVDCQEISEVRK